MEESQGKSVAKSILMHSTCSGFNEIREELINSFEMQEHNIPTYHYVVKH